MLASLAFQAWLHKLMNMPIQLELGTGKMEVQHLGREGQENTASGTAGPALEEKLGYLWSCHLQG